MIVQFTHAFYTSSVHQPCVLYKSQVPKPLLLLAKRMPHLSGLLGHVHVYCTRTCQAMCIDAVHITIVHKRHDDDARALYLTCAWGQECSCSIISPACTRRGSPLVLSCSSLNQSSTLRASVPYIYFPCGRLGEWCHLTSASFRFNAYTHVQ